MKHRRAWAVAAAILLLVLLAEVVALVSRSGLLDRDLPGPVEAARRELLPPRMTVAWVRAPLAPIATDAIVDGILASDAIAGVSEEGTAGLSAADTLALAYRVQAQEESRSAADYQRRMDDVRKKAGAAATRQRQELRWLQQAHQRMADLLKADSRELASGGDGSAPDADGLATLARLRSSALRDRFDSEVVPLIGTYSTSRGASQHIDSVEALDIMLANEARIALASRGVSLQGENGLALQRALSDKLAGLLRRKTTLGPVKWRSEVDLAVLQVLRSFGGSGAIATRKPQVNGKISAPGWKLTVGTTDLTMTISPDGSVKGEIYGLYEPDPDDKRRTRPEDRDRRAQVSGKFTGTVGGEGVIVGEGTYVVNEATRLGVEQEQGRFTLYGFPTSQGYYLGSFTLKPVSPIGMRERTLVWAEPALEDTRQPTPAPMDTN